MIVNFILTTAEIARWFTGDSVFTWARRSSIDEDALRTPSAALLAVTAVLIECCRTKNRFEWAIAVGIRKDEIRNMKGSRDCGVQQESYLFCYYLKGKCREIRMKDCERLLRFRDEMLWCSTIYCCITAPQQSYSHSCYSLLLYTASLQNREQWTENREQRGQKEGRNVRRTSKWEVIKMPL